MKYPQDPTPAAFDEWLTWAINAKRRRRAALEALRKLARRKKPSFRRWKARINNGQWIDDKVAFQLRLPLPAAVERDNHLCRFRKAA